MTRLLISAAARILFSTEVAAERIDAALTVLLADTWRRLEALVDPSALSPRLHRPAFRKALAEIDAIVFDLIETRRRNPDAAQDVLSLLLAAHETEGEAQLTDRELRDAAVTLLLSGHETTANALSWALWHAAGDEALQDADPHPLFAETLRLHPSIWILERRAVHADTLGGYRVPKGSAVLISPWLIHRHPDYWPDPDRFDPGRFTAEATQTRPRHAYIPFGLGPHRCVGLHMADRIAMQVLTRIFARFRLLRVPDQTPGMIPGITLRPSGPVLIRALRRG